jgi:hypothetical protein
LGGRLIVLKRLIFCRWRIKQWASFADAIFTSPRALDHPFSPARRRLDHFCESFFSKGNGFLARAPFSLKKNAFSKEPDFKPKSIFLAKVCFSISLEMTFSDHLLKDSSS